MLATLLVVTRFKIVQYLLLHWGKKAIVDELHCGVRIVQKIQENMIIYGSSFKSQTRKRGGSRKVHLVVEESLAAYIEEQSWAMHKEMI